MIKFQYVDFKKNIHNQRKNKNNKNIYNEYLKFYHKINHKINKSKTEISFFIIHKNCTRIMKIQL